MNEFGPETNFFFGFIAISCDYYLCFALFDLELDRKTIVCDEDPLTSQVNVTVIGDHKTII